MNKLPVVITMIESQRAQVEKLVAYCKDLDGTKVQIIPVSDEGFSTLYPDNEFANKQSSSLYKAAAAMKGKPFIWIEADSIPLKTNWVRTLTDEWSASGKSFMLSSDYNPPHDLTGGIGVYPGETNWLIPKQFQKHGWDLWVFENLRPLIHFSPLIQHSYGAYNIKGTALPYRFPKDNHILRSDSVIFHRDRYQDLITPAEVSNTPERKEVILRHGGDLGDIIAALPILRAMGGGKMILFHDPNAPAGQRGRESLEGARFDAIKPLLEVQGYVTSVEWGTGVDTSNFRTVARPPKESLVERQARHIGMWPVDLSPWLTVPSFESHNRVICARSPRYHNPYNFPWKEAAETYGDRLLFVGLAAEHAAFEQVVGRKVEHAKTKNFLDMAKIMAGSPQFIGNQSSPLWVAIGLGIKIICEVWPDHPNSSIPRPGSLYAETPAHMQLLRGAFAKVRNR